MSTVRLQIQQCCRQQCKYDQIDMETDGHDLRTHAPTAVPVHIDVPGSNTSAQVAHTVS